MRLTTADNSLLSACLSTTQPCGPKYPHSLSGSVGSTFYETKRWEEREGLIVLGFSGSSGVFKLLVREELFMPVVIRHSGILSDSIYKIGNCPFFQSNINPTSE
jgi:hypothetical protein